MSNLPTTTYDEETRTETLYYCQAEQVRYQFIAADPSQPAQESWEELEKERLCFDDKGKAVAAYRDYGNEGYLLDALMEVATEQPILEQEQLDRPLPTMQGPLPWECTKAVEMLDSLGDLGREQQKLGQPGAGRGG